MKALVIGGTGFISSRIVQYLLERGHHIALLTRGISLNKFEFDSRVKIYRGDRNDKVLLQKIIKENKFDAVYDMIAYDLGDSSVAYETFYGKIGRFIHCSTVSVYMISDKVICPITEEQDDYEVMSYFPRNPFGMEYGIKKRECEKYLWSVHNFNSFPVTTLRPPYVCGPEDRAKRDYFWIERILDGQPLLVPGSGNFATQTVFVDDLAKVFVDLLDHPETSGNAYNVASEEIFSLNDYLLNLTRLLKKEIELIHVDQDIFDSLPFSHSEEGDVFPFNTRRTAIFNIEKIKSTIGYHSTPFNQWMYKTITWFSDENQGHSFGYEKRKDEIKFAGAWKTGYSKFVKEFMR